MRVRLLTWIGQLAQVLPESAIRLLLMLFGGLGLERWMLQIRDFGYTFGQLGAPVVHFNYLYAAHEWIQARHDPFHYEHFFERLGLTDHFQFIVSDRPDFVFVSVYRYIPPRLGYVSYWWRRAVGRLRRAFDGEGLDPSSRWYSFPRIRVPSQRIFFTIENIPPDMKSCEWALGYQYEEDVGNERYTRLPIYVFCASEEELMHLAEPRDPTVLPTDRRFCVFMHRHDVPVRNALFDMLSSYRHVDAPGLCRNNMPRPATLADESFGGFDRSKLDFLRGYRFTIACENEVASGYSTEKLVTPMLAGSIPIYYGNPDVVREFNPKSFVHLEASEWKLSVADRLRILCDKVKEIDQDEQRYAAMYSEPILNSAQRYRISREHFVRRFTTIFGNCARWSNM